MARNPHTTTIDDQIWNDFNVAVSNNNRSMNDVLEEFMKYYSDGCEIVITKKIQ